MKTVLTIAAMSDMHGQLPDPATINASHICVICGDIVPLDYQRSIELIEMWLANEFKAWVEDLPVARIILIAGNHDFYFFRKDKEYIKNKFREWYRDKVVYLQDELYVYKTVRFYGCPWCTGPLNWAFCPGSKYKSITTVYPYYEQIPECDVLVTHQPPRIGNLGTSFYWDKVLAQNWGSDELRLNMKDKHIALALCGHVHSGQHTRVEYPVPGCDTIFYNVSLLNEDYNMTYKPLYLKFDKDEKVITELK